MKLKSDIVPNSPESRGKRIKYIRVNLLDISRRKLCEGSTIGVATLKGWEVGLGGGVSKTGAEKLINRLKEFNINCSINWILHGLGTEPRVDTYIIQSNEEKQIIDELLLFRRQENSIDAQIVDDSMIPSFYPGNYVAGIIAQNTEICIEKKCIVITDNNEKLVRILVRGDKPENYTLLCENTETELVQPIIKNIKIIAAAPIIFIRRKNPERTL